MILNIRIKNYRSFKDEVEFSLVAESSKIKSANVFNLSIGKEDNVRLLKTAAIFGANASGKSNFFRAFYEILKLVVKDSVKVGDDIPAYDPFLFSTETKEAPAEFSVDFVGKDNVKYRYELIFNKKNIVFELLNSYPNNKKKQLLKREIPKNTKLLKHIGYIGSISKGKKVELIHNRPLLSKFAREIVDETISSVFLYFQSIEIVNATNSRMLSSYNQEVKETAYKGKEFLEKINNLIRHSDTGINRISVNRLNEEEIKFPDNFPDKLRNQILHEFQYNLMSFHDFYKKGKLQKNEEVLPFDEESTGTKILFVLGGLLLKTLKEGRTIFIDEVDTSLHPYLTKLLVSLFQSEKINPKNAQLVFTSHDTNLLDKRLFRKDQIWFIEKNKMGVTDMFSLQDFPEVRENTPYERWYLAGKFGAVPNIKSLEKLF